MFFFLLTQRLCSPVMMTTAVCSTLSLPAGGLLPAGCGCLGAGGPDGLQGDRGGQPSAVHRGLRHPGHGKHAVPAGLPGLLRRDPREQMSAAFCE